MLFMKKFFLLICLSVIFMSCKKEPMVVFTTKNYDFRSNKNCEKDNCTYVHLEIPVASGNEMITKPINEVLFNFVNDHLHYHNQPKTTSYDTLAQQFIAEYEETSRVYPDFSVAWEADFKVKHNNLSDKVYQVVWEYYTFTGGAHGFLGTKVFFFDLQTGKQIPPKDLFVNYEGFRKYAESEFKKQMNISESFSEAGYNFGKQGFKLPENFYLTKSEWVLYYNPYEIAAYVKGASVVSLPKEKVASFLNPVYLKN